MIARTRDFGYTKGDERYEGIYPTIIPEPEEPEEEKYEDEEDETPAPPTEVDFALFKEPSKIPIILSSLCHDLHQTPSLDDNFKLQLYPAQVNQHCNKSGEWEMNARKDDYILVACRSSNDEPIPFNRPLNLTIESDPEADMFATYLREFIEYGKVYGDDWFTGVKVSAKATPNFDSEKLDRSKIILRLHDIGLLPKNSVVKLE